MTLGERIKKIRVFPYKQDQGNNYCPYHWYVIASNDGINWTKIPISNYLEGCKSYNNDECETIINNNWSTVILNNETNYMYYGIHMYDYYGVEWYSTPISEMEMYEQVLDTNSNFYIRLLTGGVSSVDTENEWDKIFTGFYK